MATKPSPPSDPTKIKVAEQELETVHHIIATPAQISALELKTAGQRKINLIWEVTQALIALISVSAGVIIMVGQSMWIGKGGEGVERDVPQTLASMIFLVLGFYFARTNHSTTGGVGTKTDEGQRRGE